MIGRVRVQIPALPAAIERTKRAIRDWTTWSRPSIAEAQRIMMEAAQVALQSKGYPGQKWAPRSAVSSYLRPTGGLENLFPLIQESLTTSSATLSLDLAGGELLQEGGTTAAGAMIAGKAVPPRQLLLIPDRAADDILKTFVQGMRERLLP